MRALILGDAERAAIADLIARAAEAPVAFERMKELAKQRERGIFLNIENDPFTVDIPMGYRCTFTHEDQPGARCRHLSVSIDSPSRGPNPLAVAQLMDAFGFVNKFEKHGAIMWLDVAPDKPIIVNLLEPLDGDLSKLQKA